MNIIRALILSSMAGLSTLIGGLIIFIPIKEHNYKVFINFCLSFSCLVMLGISLFDLLPEGINTLAKKMPLYYIVIILFLACIISYIMIKILNRTLHRYQNDYYKLGLISMITLMIHNFPEGIITFLSSIYNIRLGLKLSIAIAIHNIPEGISIAVPIYYATKSRHQGLKMTFISGLAEPLGAILAYFIIAKYINHTILAIILLFVAFLMINLSIEDIYPKIDRKEGRGAFFGMIWGIIIILLNMIM